MTQTNTGQWTTRKLLAWMIERFEEHKIESPRIISEMLLTDVLGGQRIDLYANVDRIATEQERETLREFVKRALQNEPVQYIVGKTVFFGLEFCVNTSTLIPRTCTETIVEQVIHYCADRSGTIQIADIGTGSGCIAITIAANLPNCSITATDLSPEALELAKHNACLLGFDQQITFIQGDGTTPLGTGKKFDFICSNPPYIPTCEMKDLEPNVGAWEPEIALSGGIDGLSVIKPLIDSAPSYLADDGILLIEIATSTRDKVLQIAESSPQLKDPKILRDRFGDDRFLRVLKA